MDLKSITFQHGNFEIDFGGVCINKDHVKVSYDRTDNILIGCLVSDGYTYREK